MARDDSRQGVIDFAKVFPLDESYGRGGSRRRVPKAQQVPVQEVRRLQEVRRRCGIDYSEIAQRMDIYDQRDHGGFVYRVLGQEQGVCREDFEKIFHALADIIIDRICEA